jgi:hypothetical protein
MMTNCGPRRAPFRIPGAGGRDQQARCTIIRARASGTGRAISTPDCTTVPETVRETVDAISALNKAKRARRARREARAGQERDELPAPAGYRVGYLVNRETRRRSACSERKFRSDARMVKVLPTRVNWVRDRGIAPLRADDMAHPRRGARVALLQYSGRVTSFIPFPKRLISVMTQVARLSWIIFEMQQPRDSQRNPKPSATEVSGSAPTR